MSVSRSLQRMPEVICLGELVLDLIGSPAGMPLGELRCLSVNPGGAPGNVAVALARLGIHAAYVGKLGQDAAGDLLLNRLDRDGVDVSRAVRDPRVQTTLAIVTGREDAPEFAFYPQKGAAHQGLTQKELGAGMFRGGKVLLFGSLPQTGLPSRTAVHRAIELADRLRLLTVYDPNYRPDLWKGREKEAREIIRDTARRVSIVKVSVPELEFLTGLSDPEKALESIRGDDTQMLVATLGEDGCYFITPRCRGRVPAFLVDRVADATGCGDAFVATLLAELLPFVQDGKIKHASIDDISTALKMANLVAALVTRHAGATAGLPDRASYERLKESVLADPGRLDLSFHLEGA